MPYRFRDAQCTGRELRRIAREQADRALEELGDDSVDLDKRVHSVRKRCKKLRGLLRLCRPIMRKTYKRENAALRDAARLLSETRDQRVMLDLCDDLSTELFQNPDDKRLQPLRQLFNPPEGEECDLKRRVEKFRGELLKFRNNISNWPVDDYSPSDLLDGFIKTYRRARRMRKVCQKNPNPENFHEFRKRVKYHRYHLKMMRDLWRPVVSAMYQETKTLSEELGEEHDLSIFLEHFKEKQTQLDEQTRKLLHESIRKRRRRLQKAAHRRSKPLLAEGKKLKRKSFKALF